MQPESNRNLADLLTIIPGKKRLLSLGSVGVLGGCTSFALGEVLGG